MRRASENAPTLAARPIDYPPANRRELHPFLTFIDALDTRLIALVLAHMPTFGILYWSRDQVSLTTAYEDRRMLGDLQEAVLALDIERMPRRLDMASSYSGAALKLDDALVAWDNIEHLIRMGLMVLRQYPMIVGFRIDLMDLVMSVDTIGVVAPTWREREAIAESYARVVGHALVRQFGAVLESAGARVP